MRRSFARHADARLHLHQKRIGSALDFAFCWDGIGSSRWYIGQPHIRKLQNAQKRLQFPHLYILLLLCSFTFFLRFCLPQWLAEYKVSSYGMHPAGLHPFIFDVCFHTKRRSLKRLLLLFVNFSQVRAGSQRVRRRQSRGRGFRDAGGTPKGCRSAFPSRQRMPLRR